MKTFSLILQFVAVAVASSSIPSIAGGVPKDVLLQELLGRQDLLTKDTILQSQVKHLQHAKLKRRPQIMSLKDYWDTAVASVMSSVGAMTKTAPRSSVPKVVEHRSTWTNQGAKSKRIRYGPYRVPPLNESTWQSRYLLREGIAMHTEMPVQRPCTGECMILAISSVLEYADGSPAETKNGVLYHHAALLNVGLSVKEPFCGNRFAENFFMVGQERSSARYALEEPNSTLQSGYHLNPTDSLLLSTELTNLNNVEKWVWIVFDFDYIEGYHKNYLEGKMLWHAIGSRSCSPQGEKNAAIGPTNLTDNWQPLKKEFSERSPPWKVVDDGWLLGTGAHLHAGGVSTSIILNSKQICKTKAEYFTGGAGGKEMMGHSHGRRQLKADGASNANVTYIKELPSCVYDPPQQLWKGDEMYLVADYNFTEHPGNINNKGEVDEIMGLAAHIIVSNYTRPWGLK